MSHLLIWSWVVFAVVIMASRYLRGDRVTARAPGTWAGIAIQGLGFSLIWIIHTTTLFGIVFPRMVQGTTMTWIADSIGIMSVALAVLAIWILGRNWSVAAQVVKGHQLVTRGPYRYVRHPIYTAMFGMLLATGLSMGNSLSLLVGSVAFIAGTYIRVHYEERLLRAHFGAEFEEYAASVPAFIPLTRWK
jgi:protein-S-isoprenylcysteine O-methyltransferase Ste14